MGRRLFLKNSAMAVGGVMFASSLVACATDTGENASQETESGDEALVRTKCSAKPVSVIGSNHGHVLAIPLSDALAGVAKSYNIQGTSAHPHVVAVSAAQFNQLGAGATLTVNSTSVTGHTHAIKISCT